MKMRGNREVVMLMLKRKHVMLDMKGKRKWRCSGGGGGAAARRRRGRGVWAAGVGGPVRRNLHARHLQKKTRCDHD